MSEDEHNMKLCKLCKVEKPGTEFYRTKMTKDGLRGHCKQCIKEYNKNYNKTHTRKPYAKFKTREEFIENQSINKKKWWDEQKSSGKFVHTDSICRIIKKHHELMKDDPEHLSTVFLQELVGRRCE